MVPGGREPKEDRQGVKHINADSEKEANGEGSDHSGESGDEASGEEGEDGTDSNGQKSEGDGEDSADDTVKPVSRRPMTIRRGQCR